MNFVRSAKAYYAAAFILGALIALVAALPARSAEIFPLDRDAVAPVGSIYFSGALQ